MDRRFFVSSLLATAVAAPFSSIPAFAADKKGTFKANKSRYKVRGTATVKGNSIRLSGFSTTPGPDLYVYVGNGRPTKLVGKLKANRGGQSYSFKGADKYSTVHIHCKRFSSTFGTARLR